MNIVDMEIVLRSMRENGATDVMIVAEDGALDIESIKLVRETGTVVLEAYAPVPVRELVTP